MKSNNNPSNNHAEPTSVPPDRPVPPPCASPTAVREYLEHMKPKDPEEVLGTAARRDLAVAMGLATVITVGVMAALTFIPFALSEQSTSEAGPASTAPKATAPGTPSPTPPPSTTTDKGRPTTAKDFPDKIGVTDTKSGTPKDPLDSLIDKK
jgi:hypothetical protein